MCEAGSKPSPNQHFRESIYPDPSPLAQAEDLINRMPVGVATHEIICDESGKPRDYRFLHVNPAFEELLYVSAKDVVGRTVLDVFPETEEYWIQTWGEVALGGRPAQLEGYSKSIGRHFDAHGFSIGDRRFMVVFTDVTERTTAEDAIAAAEADKRLVLDSLAEHVVYQNLDMRVLWANKAAADSVQKSRSDLMGAKCHEIWQRRDEPCVDCPVARAVKTGTEHEAEIQTPDGRIWLVRGVPVRSNGDTVGAVEITRDISDLRDSERQTELEEQKYRSLFEAAGDALFTLECTGSDAHFTDCNHRAATMFGWDRDAITGMSPSAVSPPNQPDGRPSDEAFRMYISPALAGELQRFNWVHSRKDGTPFHAEVTLSRIAAGETAILQASVRDINERVEAEHQRRRLEARIQEAQRTESLSMLAGGVAHDFNNLLTGVLGSAELALADLSPVSPARENIERIRTAALRAAELSRQMLAYSGRGQFVLEAIDISEVVRETQHLIAASVSKSARLEYDLTEPMPAIEADVTQIRQVLMALIVNASESLADSDGTIRVSSGVSRLDPGCIPAPADEVDVDESEYAYLEVADSGAGMDHDTRERMFDPFFTTKFAGRGLGLSAVLGIVRGHNGFIKVDSTFGYGTTIRAYFPLTEEPARQFRKTPPVKREQLLGKTVLIVDDEPAVLEVGRIMVEKAGGVVLTAKDGGEAEAVFREREEEIDCVLLDLTMPGIGGEETLERLRRIREDVRVILSSGYSKHEVETQFGGEGFAGFLQKPYKRNRLLRTLGDAIEG